MHNNISHEEQQRYNKRFLEFCETDSNIGKKMSLILETGKILMESGADTRRITSVMKRAAMCMGLKKEDVHIHITYTTIMLNINSGNHSITKFQKCLHHGINMTMVSAISRMTWQATADNYTLKQYQSELKKLLALKRNYSPLATTICAGFACGAFCKLFGCDWMSFFYTSFCAAVGFYSKSLCTRFDINPYASVAIASFISTVLAFITSFMPGSSTPLHQMLACALFVIPGVPLINCIEDLLDSYIISGTTRGINTILVVGSMSFGIFFAIKLCNVQNFSLINMKPEYEFFSSYITFSIAAAIAAMGFSTIFNVPKRLLVFIAIGGIISVCTRNFINFDMNMGLPLGSFIGAVAVSIYASCILNYVQTPMYVITIPSVIPMIPGVLMYRLMFGIINIGKLNIVSFMNIFHWGVIAILTTLGIAVGAAIPNILAKKYLQNTHLNM